MKKIRIKWSRFILTLIIMIIVVLAVVNGVRYISLKNVSEELIDQLHSGDMTKIQMGTYNVPDRIPKEAKAIIEAENSQGSNNLVLKVLKKTKIRAKVSWISNKVTYTFMSPDIEGFMLSLNGNDYQDEEALLAAIDKYLDTGVTKERTSVIEYQRNNGEWDCEYLAEEFIDGMTGGMVSGYEKLFNKTLKSYADLFNAEDKIKKYHSNN